MNCCFLRLLKHQEVFPLLLFLSWQLVVKARRSAAGDGVAPKEDHPNENAVYSEADRAEFFPDRDKWTFVIAGVVAFFSIAAMLYKCYKMANLHIRRQDVGSKLDKLRLKRKRCSHHLEELEEDESRRAKKKKEEEEYTKFRNIHSELYI